MTKVRSGVLLLLWSLTVRLLAQGPEWDPWRAKVAVAERFRNDGQFREAEHAYLAALEAARLLEPDLIPSATTYNNLANVYQDEGHCDQAVRAYQRSIVLWQRVDERGGKYLLETANHLVSLYLECGDVAEAERHYLALIAPLIESRAGRERDADVARALTNLGSIQYQKHRFAESRAAYEEALAMRGRIASPPRETAILLNNLAFSLTRMREMEPALDCSRRAVEMLESVGGPTDPLLITALTNAANVRLAAGRGPEAEPLLDRALKLSRQSFGDEHPLTLNALVSYAAMLKAGHRKKEAAVLEGQIRAIRARMSDVQVRQTVDVGELLRMR